MGIWKAGRVDGRLGGCLDDHERLGEGKSGWMDGWENGKLGRWKPGRMDESKVGRLGGLIDGLGGRKSWRMKGWVDRSLVG
jgi:hypothetical protein